MSIVVDKMTVSGNAIANGLTLDAPAGTNPYTPALIRSAYGVSALAEDGTGQTIAIVDAYDDPDLALSLDTFDSQFGLTADGETLYQQYGPASSFLTIVNQAGQTTPSPATDPAGPGTDNWEVEEALDVEWVHAFAPGAQIVLVEANSQSLSDLMAGVVTGSHLPGVSVVSMSWGFPEGQAVFASDEATFDADFNVPGVTFVASTGDYGAADPEYPAYSPNVVAVGGTSLSLNGDNTYQGEAGWGYQSAAAGMFIGSGGGLSMYESEPAYQQGIQSTGSRSTPDVSLVADPATGVWIADSYNLDPANPFEVVGGTSLSAPAWAGLLALVNQGRSATGRPTLNSASPIETQQALYTLPQSAYNVVATGSNGYTAHAGYNLVTGLGTPIANVLAPELVVYDGPGTTYLGSPVAPLQDETRTDTGAGNSATNNVFSVFDSITFTTAGPADSTHSIGTGLDAISNQTVRPAAPFATGTGPDFVSLQPSRVDVQARSVAFDSSVSTAFAISPQFGPVSSSSTVAVWQPSLTRNAPAAPGLRVSSVFPGGPTWRPRRSWSSAESTNSSTSKSVDPDQTQLEEHALRVDPTSCAHSSPVMFWDQAISTYFTAVDEAVPPDGADLNSSATDSDEPQAASPLQSLLMAGGAAALGVFCHVRSRIDARRARRSDNKLR